MRRRVEKNSHDIFIQTDLFECSIKNHLSPTRTEKLKVIFLINLLFFICHWHMRKRERKSVCLLMCDDIESKRE
jgi:hypothetical protein